MKIIAKLTIFIDCGNCRHQRHKRGIELKSDELDFFNRRTTFTIMCNICSARIGQLNLEDCGRYYIWKSYYSSRHGLDYTEHHVKVIP